MVKRREMWRYVEAENGRKDEKIRQLKEERKSFGKGSEDVFFKGFGAGGGWITDMRKRKKKSEKLL